jgi:signal transduction histidine kinase
MLSDDIGKYYLMATNADFHDIAVTYLVYKEVTSTIAFKDSMNQTLAVLLVGLAVVFIVIYVIMSTKFNAAIKRLCRYAEDIGNGNFSESRSKFKHAEFDRLSGSMTKMACMLQAYEDRQKQFFQNASHELRTPLMSIQGYAEGILEDIFSKEMAAEVILAEGARMPEMGSSPFPALW